MPKTISISKQTPWDEQDKDATTPYSFDLADLIPAGDTLSSCVWTVTPSGGPIVDGSQLNGTKVLLRVAGNSAPVESWYSFTARWETVAGVVDNFTFRLFIKDDPETVPVLGTALFPNRFTAVANLRQDNLMMAAAGVLPAVDVSDDYVWEKLVAAESELSRRLRVRFAPTTFFPLPPSQAQIDALNGAPWDIDTPYDYAPEMFQGERWGFIVTREKPLQSVTSIRFAYPSPTVGIFDVPPDWIRFDRKYGHIRLIPASSANIAPLNAFILMALGGGRTVPFMVQITYVAGLANARTEYPELVDAVKKLAIAKILADAYLPQSGSISADGLSQSQSVDPEKYLQAVDLIVDGPKGSNGGLMTAIHGIRVGFMGL